MPNNFKEQFTNILLFLVAAFGGVLGTTILNTQNKIQEDLTIIKVAIGVMQNEEKNILEKNKEQDELLKKRISKYSQRLFKNEDFITLKK